MKIALLYNTHCIAGCAFKLSQKVNLISQDEITLFIQILCQLEEQKGVCEKQHLKMSQQS